MKIGDLYYYVATNRERWIVEEEDVTNVLGVIDNHRKLYINPKLRVSECEDDINFGKWIISFNSSIDQQMNILGELGKRGFELVLTKNPRRVYLLRKTSESLL